MHGAVDLVSSLGRTTLGDQEYELFAEAHSVYDAAAGMLTVDLSGYLHPETMDHLSERIVPPWMPAPQSDREHVPADECSDLAKEIFRLWCSKVRDAAPNLRHP